MGFQRTNEVWCEISSIGTTIVRLFAFILVDLTFLDSVFLGSANFDFAELPCGLQSNT